MSDIKLFSMDDKPKQIKRKTVKLEKNMQSLIEHNLEIFFGIKFLATEFNTGKKHRGRIDTLGIDENGSPVIIEYKRHKNENVMNQGLYYFDWLLDHKANFEKLARKKGVKEKDIDWSSPRLLCIAEDFTKYDSYAVEQIDRNIELIRFQKYEDIILFELVNAVESKTKTESNTNFQDYLKKAPKNIKELYEQLDDFILSLGDDVQKKELKHYCAYKKIRNFTCVEVHQSKILVFLKLDPNEINLKNSRDVSNIGHFGTGDVEIKIKNMNQVYEVQRYIEKSYLEN